MMGNECPSILPPSSTSQNYYLHVNLSPDIRPPLTIRASTLGPLEQFFNQSLFECVVCTGDCVVEEDIIFRLQARAVRAADGIGNAIECLGDTVRPICRALVDIYACSNIYHIAHVERYTCILAMYVH